MIPYRRKGDLDFAPAPSMNTGSIEIEQTMEQQADRLCGLDENSQISQVRQQFLVDKFLQHSAEVLRMCYRCFQRFGPDSIFFRVTGVPDAQTFDKGDPNENFDIIVNYDVLNSDTESQKEKLDQIVSLTQMDRSGRINIDRLLDTVANAIDPVLADSILQPTEVAQQQVVNKVTDDLSKIYSGIEVNAQPNGAQIALQLIQEYAQQPDILQRLQSDQSFAARLEKYSAQYTFQLQQMENAEIGRLGTAPAEMQSPEG
jgi:hypothetical protein